MWDITYNIKKMIPPQKSGYNFLKTIKLFIPYKEIGLNILARKEQPLPFFYEIILKLVDCKYNEILSISNITGVEEEIIIDVIGEMSINNLIYIKADLITLTPAGKLALNDLKKNVIEKELINNIYINSITGKIEDLNKIYKKPQFRSPCLDGKIKITDEFITGNFNNFNEYYQKRQEDYDTKGQGVIAKNEIYQIIDEEYENLCYIEETAHIYINVRDNDLSYQCKNDVDNIYGTNLARQINNSTGARNFLDNRFKCEKYLNENIVIDEEKRQNTEMLIKLVESNDFNKNLNEEVYKHYFTDRYLLEKEYLEILLLIKAIKPSEIIISSGVLNEIINHNVIVGLHEALDYAKIFIISDCEERNIAKFKNTIMDAKKKRKNNIQWVSSSDVKETNILLYPKCGINIKYKPIPVGKDFLIHEIADITFNSQKIGEKKEQLLSKYTSEL